MEKLYKIHPKTLSVSIPNGVVTDKESVLPESIWGEDLAAKLVEEGFLIEVEQSVNETGLTEEELLEKQKVLLETTSKKKK